ncbi:response regulator transcription factor [Sphingobacterium sp. LRF_L2]|uniref:response regulator transcription factor n=1 Tax=Sphingobacterium sp. LRF_L2 TaxID=3369421 RepID=UPI003F5FE52D
MSLSFTKTIAKSLNLKISDDHHPTLSSCYKRETTKPVILLVEDDKEVLAYLNKELKTDYMILRATNGNEALAILAENEVQLVITEIITPIIDGITLCKHIKTEVSYSHIPVIFLTAQNTLEIKIKGLNSGADAYIEKPFSLDFLLAQMQNILNNRKIVRNYFAQFFSPNQHNSATVATEDFTEQLNKIIYANISDIDLNVDELAKLMNMSRPTLYRKVKQYSDLTPNEMINIAKLKKAAELLAQKKYNITQIANMVGYSVQSNFSRDFHKHFGIPPSIYTMGITKQHDVA